MKVALFPPVNVLFASPSMDVEKSVDSRSGFLLLLKRQVRDNSGEGRLFPGNLVLTIWEQVPATYQTGLRRYKP